MMLLGPVNFLLSIAIPFFLMLGLGKYEIQPGQNLDYNYYRQPWEASADMFGGLNARAHSNYAGRSQVDETIAKEYLLMAYFLGPISYLQFDNKYNIIK